MNDGYPTQAPINTGRLVALITGAAITLGALGCTTLAASGVITSTNATEATVGGAGAITTAGGIFATKKIISASTVTGTQLVSTVATGTAPLTVASTTVVANLNASLLNGTTWAAPGAIGGTTPAAVACTTLTASGAVSSASVFKTMISTYGTTGSPAETPIAIGKFSVGDSDPAGMYSLNGFSSGDHNWLSFKVTNTGVTSTALTLNRDLSATFASSVACTSLTFATNYTLSAGGTASSAKLKSGGASNYWQMNDSSDAILGYIGFTAIDDIRCYSSTSVQMLRLTPTAATFPGSVSCTTLTASAVLGITGDYESDTILTGRFLGGHLGYTGIRQGATNHDFNIDVFNDGAFINALKITQAGAATFASSVSCTKVLIGADQGGQANIAGVPDVAAGNICASDTTAFAAGVGGRITMWGKYTSGGAYANFAEIAGRKAIATDGNYTGIVVLRVQTGAAVADTLVISGIDHKATFTGKITANGAAAASTMTGMTTAQLITYLQTIIA